MAKLLLNEPRVSNHANDHDTEIMEKTFLSCWISAERKGSLHRLATMGYFQPFWCRCWDILGELSQYCDCWSPDSMHLQAIISSGVDCRIKSSLFSVRKDITPVLTHLASDRMAAVLQMIFSDAFSWMKNFVFLSKFHRGLFLSIQLTITQHWFWWWLGAKKARSHYLNQCLPPTVMFSDYCTAVCLIHSNTVLPWLFSLSSLVGLIKCPVGPLAGGAQ